MNAYTLSCLLVLSYTISYRATCLGNGAPIVVWIFLQQLNFLGHFPKDKPTSQLNVESIPLKLSTRVVLGGTKLTIRADH